MVSPKGIYKHFKGDYYALFGIAKHTETNDDLVLYVKLNGDGTVFARPLNMFYEKIKINNELKPRFERIA